MCSFDVSSLFTSIPLDETIGYCLDKLFTDCDTVRGLNRKQLHRLLCFSAKESHFLFDGAIYDQVDGVAMGSPLGPVLANIFMCKLEEQAITNFPGNRPIVYINMLMTLFLCLRTKLIWKSSFSGSTSSTHKLSSLVKRRRMALYLSWMSWSKGQQMDPCALLFTGNPLFQDFTFVGTALFLKPLRKD